METRTTGNRISKAGAASILAAALVVASCVATAKEATPQTVTVPAGTKLVVRTASTLSTKSSPAGSTFSATLAKPLLDGERVIAPKGAEVVGRVVHSDRGGRVKGRATIAVSLTRIHGGGKSIPITTNAVWLSARGTKKRDALSIGAGSGAGAAIGAIAGGGAGAAIGAGVGAGAGLGTVLVTRGAPAVIRAETVLTFQLREPVKVRQAS